MAISAKDVKTLRDRTQAGFGDCKKALEAVDGDMDKAVDWLRKKGLSDAGKKAGRVAAEGAVFSYIHAGGKLGVLLEVNCETDFVARGEDFQTFVKEVAMHVAAAAPLYLRSDEIPPADVEQEKAIFKAQVLEQGKPENIADKIVDGKIKKWYSEVCLMDQAWVKEPKMTIEDLRTEVVRKTGENVQIRRFTRYVLGEGIEKKQENLAEEVAKMAEKAKAAAESEAAPAPAETESPPKASKSKAKSKSKSKSKK